MAGNPVHLAASPRIEIRSGRLEWTRGREHVPRVGAGVIEWGGEKVSTGVENQEVQAGDP